MAIAFDAASTGSVSADGSVNYDLSHTCTGSNRALVVSVVADSAADRVTGVTYNSVAMTLIDKGQASGGRWHYLYYLNAPSTGANNIRVTTNATCYREVNAASYTGVAQTGQPEASAKSNSASASSITGTVTTTTDNAWTVMGINGAAGTITAGASTTRRGTTLVGAIFDSNAAVTPAGSASLIGNQTSSAAISQVIAAIAPHVVTDTISVTAPAAFKVFQRSGSTGSIGITGTVAGSTEDIEASFNGGAYATIATAVAPGSFTGTLSSQTAGQGTLTVRKKTTTTTSTTVANVGIGDVFVVCGDSISEGRGTNAQSYSHATLKAAKFTQADAWGEGNDGIDTGTSSGSHWPLLATQIMADQSVPVAFISCGTGSTDVAGSANQWAKNNSGYAEMTAQVTASGVNSVKGVLMHLGPNAVVNASTLSQATYNAALDTLAADIAADIAGAPKLHIGIFGEVSTGSPPDRTAALNNLRAAIIQAHGDNANIKPGPCLVDLNYSDGVHPQSDADLAAVAKRWWVALKESLYSGSGGRGPRVSSAQWNAGRTEITIVFDRVLKTGLTFGTGCWAVSDNGTPMTVSSVAYHGSNTSALIVTVSAAATGPAASTTVTFANGDTAVGLVVPLSTDITMPSGAAIQIPAEPIYAQTVSETGAVVAALHGLTRSTLTSGRLVA